MRTYSAKPGEADRQWFVVDASEYELGRLATRIATILRGKHKPTFTPHVDGGDFVIVINASQVKLTGRKVDQKHYHRYSGYPGGLRSIDARTVRESDPGTDDSAGSPGHAPQEPPLAVRDQQAQGVRRHGSSACCSEAPALPDGLR